MTTVLCLLPFAASTITGYLFLKAFLPDEKDSGMLLLFLGGGFGLAVQSSLIFYSLIIFGQYSQGVTIGVSIILLVAALIYARRKNSFRFQNPFDGFDEYASIVLPILVFGMIPLWMYSKFYPMGGWDAWQVWNFKSKFMLTAGTNWTNIFDPALWRNSPHYPLLLPSVNVWSWSFINRPDSVGPLLTSAIFTFLTVGLLTAALKQTTQNKFSIFAGLSILMLPFFIRLTTGQYCDILIAYYLLAGLYTLLRAYNGKDRAWIMLAGFFIGTLSFTKSEAQVAALFLTVIGTIHLFWQNPNAKKSILLLWGSVLVGALPTILFQLMYSPGNQTFINGLTSQTDPSTLGRLKMIFAFLLVGLQSKNWGGLWILLLVGLILKIKHLLRRDLLIFPAFFLSYLAVILGYYYLNTYFEITWWLQVTLGRIQFSVLPAVMFWVFTLICEKKKETPAE